jgi:hypothetical protein
MHMVKIAPTLLGSAGMLLLSSLTVSAKPASMGDVLQACSNTPSCHMSKEKDGDVSGCSGHAC